MLNLMVFSPKNKRVAEEDHMELKTSCLLIIETVIRNYKRRKTNLFISWVDFRKAYDLVPHSWILESLRITGAADNMVRFLGNSMKNWKTQLAANGADLGTVRIRRGIFQGDSLSPLLFVTSMIPVTIILRSLKQGYSLDKKSKINHSLYMDDLKLYGKSNNEIDTLIQKVRIYTIDIGMKFGLDKCGAIAMKRGKVTACEGIMLNDKEVIGDVSIEGYRYFGIVERGDIAHEEMKQKTWKEYMDRVRKVMKSKLNGGNVIKAINTWATPLIRYGAGIIDWTKNEIDEIDRKT